MSFLYGTNHKELNSFIELANNYHPTIKFTAEISDSEITFLDTCLYKSERFSEGIYSRRAHALQTDRNFSNTRTFPPASLQASGKALSKAKLMTSENNSSKATFEENIRQFKRRLRARGYPGNLFNFYSLRN